MITKIKIRPKPSSRPSVMYQETGGRTEEPKYSINMEYKPEEDKVHLEYNDGAETIRLELKGEKHASKEISPKPKNMKIEYETHPEVVIIEFTGTVDPYFRMADKSRIEIITLRNME